MDIVKRKIMSSAIPEEDKQVLLKAVQLGEITPEQADKLAQSGGEAMAQGGGSISGGVDRGSGSGVIINSERHGVQFPAAPNPVRQRLAPKLPAGVDNPQQLEQREAGNIDQHIKDRLLRKQALAQELTKEEDLSELRKQARENAVLQSIIQSGLAGLGNITGTDMSQHIKGTELLTKLPNQQIADAQADRAASEKRAIQAESLIPDEVKSAGEAQAYTQGEQQLAKSNLDIQKFQADFADASLRKDPASTSSRALQSLAIKLGMEPRLAQSMSAEDLQGLTGTLTNIYTSDQAKMSAQDRMKYERDVAAFEAKAKEANEAWEKGFAEKKFAHQQEMDKAQLGLKANELTSKNASAGTPKEKQLGEAAVGEIAALNNTINLAQKTADLVKSGAPVGPGNTMIQETRGFANKIPVIGQAVSDPDKRYTAIDNNLGTMFAEFKKALSGATVSDAEAEALGKLMPKVSDTPQMFITKMNNFRDNAIGRLESRLAIEGAAGRDVSKVQATIDALKNMKFEEPAGSKPLQQAPANQQTNFDRNQFRTN